MALAHTVAQAAASVAPSLSPSPSVSPSPVVHAAAAHAATVVSSGWLDLINAWLGNVSQADIIAVAGLLATALQSLLNKHPWLQSDLKRVQDLKRFVVAMALPYLGVLIGSFASGQNTLHLWLPVFIVGQVAFYTVQLFKQLVLNRALNAKLAQAAEPQFEETTQGQG